MKRKDGIFYMDLLNEYDQDWLKASRLEALAAKGDTAAQLEIERMKKSPLVLDHDYEMFIKRNKGVPELEESKITPAYDDIE